MSLFGLKFSQMILHTETSKLMYNWSFLFEVLHKPTLNTQYLLNKHPSFLYMYVLKGAELKIYL